MKGLRALYILGIILIAVLIIFIHFLVLNPVIPSASEVEHSSIITAQESIIGFKIHNLKDKDQNNTFMIFLNDKKLTEDNPILVRVNRTWGYNIHFPSQTEGRLNVLIYRGAGEGKMLIDNKTYYLK